MKVDKQVNPRFYDFLWDWDYKRYLLVGGYGSSKSYHIALKIVLKLLKEKRTCLVVRQVYETIRESCFSLFQEILDDLELLDTGARKLRSEKVRATINPMSIIFPNGSKIIFKGVDKQAKLKSIHNISIVWLEEASEINYAGYKELVGRLRHPTLSLHMILSTNPVDTQNWVYTHFFVDEENDRITLDPKIMYEHGTVVKGGVYYHHSRPEHNLFLPYSYVEELDDMKNYDPDLWRVARLGEFGANGLKVLPQIEKMEHDLVMAKVRSIPEEFRFNGLDWGFEESYNALVRVAVDTQETSLYIYHEYYTNHLTDPQIAEDIKYMKNHLIIADSEDPKAIKYFNMNGFRMRGSRKFNGSRLANTRKVKRFKHIYVSSECKSTWRELSQLTYLEKPDGTKVYDEFNIDPHTFNLLGVYKSLEKRKRCDANPSGSLIVLAA